MATITILGAGYVGLPTAVLFALSGHHVFLVEPDQKRLSTIKGGSSFFVEHGLDQLVQAALQSGRFIATDSYEESASTSDFVFSCVGTPDMPQGDLNLEYVLGAAREAAIYMPDHAIFVQKSTVPVGTGAEIQALFTQMQRKLYYVSNPEFLRESTAIHDSLYPDRVVVGGDEEPVNAVLDLYCQLELYREDIARISLVTSVDMSVEYCKVDLNSAEMIKVGANAFLALKISFANDMARYADAVGADVKQVLSVIGADHRIGTAFLQAGRGFGGGCFPKDLKGIIASAADHGVAMPTLTAAQQVNKVMPKHIVGKTGKHLGGLRGKRVALLGLAFKAGTSDVRKSPGIALADRFVEYGANVLAFDPEALDEARGHCRNDVLLVHSFEEAVTGVDAVVIATEWPQFIERDPENFAQLMQGDLFVDAVNGCDKPAVEAAGLRYIGVGR